MRRPLIGISCNVRPHEGENGNYCIDRSYADAVFKAGGMPQMMPLLPDEQIEALISMYDGILLSGGGGLLPEIKKMDNLPSLKEQNPTRYAFESRIIEIAIDKKTPILGICRGMQMINDVTGGTVVNLATKKHRQKDPGDEGTHKIVVEPDSMLIEAVQGDNVLVNSFHSQVVGEIGSHLKVNCYSDDGFIEGIEFKDKSQYIMGVQFHPEFMINEVQMYNIYAQFIEQARLNKS